MSETPNPNAPEEESSSEPEEEADTVAPAEDTLPIDDELSQAVRNAQVGPYIPGGKFNPPNTIKILVFVVLAIIAGSIYFIVFAATSMQRSDKIRLRTLEEKAYFYEKQQRFVKANGYVPAGKTYKPLTPEERGELDGLRDRYGRMQVVDPDAAKATESPANAPATAPVG